MVLYAANLTNTMRSQYTNNAGPVLHNEKRVISPHLLAPHVRGSGFFQVLSGTAIAIMPNEAMPAFASADFNAHRILTYTYSVQSRRNICAQPSRPETGEILHSAWLEITHVHIQS